MTAMTVYTPLRSPPESSIVEEDDALHPPTKRLSAIRLCLITCIICTVINTILAIRLELGRRSSNTQFAPTTYKNIHHLRRPSQFIRFDEIERPSPPIAKQFNNYPILTTQVDSANKDKVFEDDARRYMAPIGTISPKDKRVLVTDTVSTIVQFRAIDYGMERCELHLSLPSISNTLLSNNRSMALSIHRLNTSIPLDVTTLSYKSKPKQMTTVGNVQVTYEKGKVWHRSFSCATEEVLTFELTCSSETTTADGCHVEWWQNVKTPNPGLYIIQHSTV